jgi:hypothetical protein
MELKKTYNYIPKFFCEPCDFKCCIKSDMDRHMNTRKHKVSAGGINLELNYINLHSSQKNYVCCCGKIYNTQSGLWKHKQKCNNTICEEENVVIKENDVLDIEAMGGKGDNDYEKDTKIIKKIAKVVGIDKN